MSYEDMQTKFAAAQRFCNAGATEASENVYDFGSADPNAGRGEPIRFLCTVNSAFTGTATTLTVSIQDSDDNADSDPYADIAGASSGAIAKATLVAGYQFILTLPNVHKRWIRFMCTGDNTFETTGTMSIQQILTDQTNRKPGVA